jgi:PKD repeat protein
VTFTATTSDPDLGDSVAVGWSFDDSATATGTEVTHAFATGGTHTATATATDSAGVTTVRAVTLAVAVPAAKPKQKDLAPPTTIGLKGPKKVRRGKPAIFRFGSSEAGGTFRCRVDSKPLKTCASPFRVTTKKLAPGRPHTFAVFAVDPAGNADPTPLKRSFRVK